MPKPLVVVESPAKAKTIARFLGPEFEVKASVGHIADLPTKGLGVDIEGGFTPLYELTPRGKDVVKELKALLKDASELYLATDEDREGEIISWHLLQHLKPRVPVKRMVFHEITRAAIERAVANPRDVDEGLVDAAESRRVLDRLYGFEVSPVLWKKVKPGLAAGRVQSPATRLVVEREWDRIRFVTAGYWGIDAAFATDPQFTGTLTAVDGRKVATGKDFDESGRAKADVVVLDEVAARSLADGLDGETFTVASVEERPYRSSPKAPFMTSTLQQEGGRKLRMSANQVMRIAQGLYERGFITYMRTDSTELSTDAIGEARATVEQLYGKEFVSPTARTWTGKVKNAQEAHEAIRPTTPFRAPSAVASELSGTDLRLYEMVWQRTLASQMADATGVTVSLRTEATARDGRRAEFATSGTTITFAGYRRVYIESVDDDDASDSEAQLPRVEEGTVVPVESLEPKGHTTSAPSRYTEASLVKKLEELGIGRPSTWASIMETIQDRGYVWKKGQALVPTWTAFVVVRLLENHFKGLVDYGFTAEMEEELDRIASGTVDKLVYLHRFYFGNGELGLHQLVTENLDLIDAAEINAVLLGLDGNGETIVVRPGKYGPYVKRGDDTASVPDDLAPDELTVLKALELLDAPKGDVPIGLHEGLPVYAKNGRFGPYVQWGDADALPPGFDKPKMASLFKTMTLERVSLDDAVTLLSLPRTVGVDPADDEEITAQNGRYGPYVSKGKESRSLDNEERLFTVTLEEALGLLAAPKQYRGRGRSEPKPPLAEFGADPASGRPIVAKEGRFGVYVTDGETNASIGRGDRIETMTAERAQELLAVRRETIAAGGGAPRKPAKRPAAKKASAAKKATGAKKAASPKRTGSKP
ncbi:MAG: type I DNA topoisomerase [Acidimicrobiales bacterium]